MDLKTTLAKIWPVTGKWVNLYRLHTGELRMGEAVHADQIAAELEFLIDMQALIETLPNSWQIEELGSETCPTYVGAVALYNTEK